MFWLRPDKPEEQHLIDLIVYLKSKGEFSSAIRDGLRLVTALRNREWDAALSMFPELQTHVDNLILEATLEAYKDAAGRPINIVQQQAQAVMLEQGSQPAPAPPGPKRIEAPQFAAPDDDNDDDAGLVDIRLDKSAGADATANFFSSMEAFQR